MVEEILPHELAARLSSGGATRLIDVRQQWEHELVALPGSELVPLDELAHDEIDVAPAAPEELVVVYCHHGVRSLTGALLLQQRGIGQRVVSLAGGIDAWSLEIDPSVRRY